MWKIKQKDIYSLTYDVKLNRGKMFKATTELDSILNKIEEYSNKEETDETIEKLERYKRLETKKRLEINRYKQIVEEKQELLTRSESGERDREYQEKFEKKQDEKELNKQKRYDKRNETNKTNKEKSQRYYQNSYQSRRDERFKEKDYKYHYKIFQQKSNSLPNWMKHNLTRMKNNEGYIWRKVWFFGALPQDEDNSNLCLYEYTPQKIFTKKYKDGCWTITSRKNPRYKKR